MELLNVDRPEDRSPDPNPARDQDHRPGLPAAALALVVVGALAAFLLSGSDMPVPPPPPDPEDEALGPPATDVLDETVDAVTISECRDPLDMGLPRGHAGLIRATAFSADGNLFTVGERDVVVWNGRSGIPIRRYDLPTPDRNEPSASSPDGSVLAVLDPAMGSLQMIDLYTGATVGRRLANRDWAQTLDPTFTPDGAALVTMAGDGDGIQAVVNRLDGTDADREVIELAAEEVEMGPDSRFSVPAPDLLVAADAGRSRLVAWSLTTGRRLDTATPESGYSYDARSAVGPGGGVLVVGRDLAAVMGRSLLFDLFTGDPVADRFGLAEVTWVANGGGGRYLLLLGSTRSGGDETLVVWDIGGAGPGVEVGRRVFDDPVHAISVSADGSSLAWADDRGGFSLADLDPDLTVRRRGLTGNSGTADRIVIDDFGDLAATVGVDGPRFWELSANGATADGTALADLGYRLQQRSDGLVSEPVYYSPLAVEVRGGGADVVVVDTDHDPPLSLGSVPLDGLAVGASVGGDGEVVAAVVASDAGLDLELIRVGDGRVLGRYPLGPLGDDVRDVDLSRNWAHLALLIGDQAHFLCVGR